VESGRESLGDNDAFADNATFPQIEIASFSDGRCTVFAKYEVNAYATTFARSNRPITQ
jgi:hypothetical protein